MRNSELISYNFNERLSLVELCFSNPLFFTVNSNDRYMEYAYDIDTEMRMRERFFEQEVIIYPTMFNAYYLRFLSRWMIRSLYYIYHIRGVTLLKLCCNGDKILLKIYINKSIIGPGFIKNSVSYILSDNMSYFFNMTKQYQKSITNTYNKCIIDEDDDYRMYGNEHFMFEKTISFFNLLLIEKKDFRVNLTYGNGNSFDSIKNKLTKFGKNIFNILYNNCECIDYIRIYPYSIILRLNDVGYFEWLKNKFDNKNFHFLNSYERTTWNNLLSQINTLDGHSQIHHFEIESFDFRSMGSLPF